MLPYVDGEVSLALFLRAFFLPLLLLVCSIAHTLLVGPGLLPAEPLSSPLAHLPLLHPLSVGVRLCMVVAVVQAALSNGRMRRLRSLIAQEWSKANMLTASMLMSSTYLPPLLAYFITSSTAVSPVVSTAVLSVVPTFESSMSLSLGSLLWPMSCSGAGAVPLLLLILSWHFQRNRAPELSVFMDLLEDDHEDVMIRDAGVAPLDLPPERDLRVPLGEQRRLGPYWARLVQAAKSNFQTAGSANTPAQREVVRRWMNGYARDHQVRVAHIAKYLDRCVVAAFVPSASQIEAVRLDASEEAAEMRRLYQQWARVQPVN